MSRYLIPPLLIILALAGLLLYVGGSEMLSLTVLGKTYETKLQIAILLLFGAVIGIILLWSALVWAWRLPKRVKTGYGRMRSTNGLDAIEDALIAGEAGDGERARKRARRASELLGRPALSALVSAKAAEAAMDYDGAHQHYSTLLDDEKTKAAGLRGLARIAQAQGNFDQTIDMTSAAYHSQKAPSWAFDPLFRAQIAIQDWDGALETLALAEKRKHIDKSIARRRRAVLYAAKAAQLDAQDDSESARDMALKSHDIDPGFAPASALAARLLAHAGNTKKAASLLEKAWRQAPHPALSLAYFDLFSKDNSKTQAKTLAKHVKALIKANPEHRESHIIQAEQALARKEGLAALQALGPLLRDEDPSVRLCLLAQTAETLLGNRVDARAWQLRAANAPLEIDWSDLDPDGDAFNYTPEDWQKLVISYGENGMLIHPRFENNKRRKPVIELDMEPEPGEQSTADNAEAPSLNIDADQAKDISNRIENLMDGDDTP